MNDLLAMSFGKNMKSTQNSKTIQSSTKKFVGQERARHGEKSVFYNNNKSLTRSSIPDIITLGFNSQESVREYAQASHLQL